MKAAALLLLLALAQDGTERLKAVLPSGDAFEVGIPKGWEGTLVQPRPTIPPTLRIFGPQRAELSLQMTFIPLKEGKLGSTDEIKDSARKSFAQFVASSVEKKIELVPLPSKTGEGYYCTFTDQSLVDLTPLPKGSYVKMTSGLFVISRALVTFTILYNPGGEALQKAALEAVGKTQPLAPK